MGSSPSTQENQVIHTMILTPKVHPQTQISAGNLQNNSSVIPLIINSQKQIIYTIPQLQTVIMKAHKDLHSRDPIGIKRYFFQVVNFIFEWLKQSMQKGMSLYDAEQLVSKDLLQACLQYPIGKIEKIQSSIKDLKPSNMPNLIQDIEQLTKQKFTDRIKQFCIRSKQVSYQFNKQMQIILEKQGGFDFKGGHKNTGVKAYMRILTKILQEFLSSKQGSKQVYTNMDHYFWTPIFEYLNKLIDKNIQKIKVQVYDWIRCRVFYKTIQQLQLAFARLQQKFGQNIFRVKNRINLHTRDVLINLKYKTQYAQIQLALFYDSSAYDFNHKLYQLTRQKLGVAYCCFTILLNQIGDLDTHLIGIMTNSGYIKRSALREKIEDDFQRLTQQDAELQWDSIVSLLSQWDIVALNTGVIKGSGYQKRLEQQMYGPQIAEMMVIKRRSDNQLTNWLNWMD